MFEALTLRSVKRSRAWNCRAARQRPPTELHLGLTQRFFETGEAPVPCSTGHAALTIDPYGGVLQCDSRDSAMTTLQAHDFDIVAMCRSQSFRDALRPLSGCRECWTPCQAYPSIIHHPVESLANYAKAVIR